MSRFPSSYISHLFCETTNLDNGYNLNCRKVERKWADNTQFSICLLRIADLIFKSESNEQINRFASELCVCQREGEESL